MRNLLFILLTSCIACAEGPTGYYRFPAIHGDTVIFTSEGDLWTVPAKGGVAQRLTTHPGLETRASFSPDGANVAFSAQYEGPTEVYVMPLAGGAPKRLTWESRNAGVAGWTPDGRVLYSTDAFATLPTRQLSIVNPKDATRELLPLAQANEGAYVDKTLFFTRFPKQSSSTKRYRGGWVENLWKITPGDAEATPLTADFTGTCRNPMVWDGRIVFVSDRDGTMNLWSMKPDGSDTRQLTKHKGFDVKSAALEGGRVVYQHGADLRLLNIASGTDGVIPITLASDFDQVRERWVKKPAEYLTSSHVSPNGDRVVLTARGRVFVAPVEQGRLVEVPSPQSVRLRGGRFFPDGKSLLTLSDESGELEFWKYSADGLSSPSQLTANGTVYRTGSLPSPDGLWIAWTDKDQKLWVHQIDKKETVLVAENKEDDITDFAWSSDSGWLAYVERASNSYRQIKLFRVADGSRTTLTNDRTDSFSPTWSPDGKWLYFLSDRQLRSLVGSPWGMRQPEPFFTEATKIYQVALTKGLRSPFAPRDELHDEPKPEKKPDEKPADKPANGAEKKAITIDLDGLAERVSEVPVPAGNFFELNATAKHIFWMAADLGFDAKRHLRQLEISRDNPKAKTFVEDISSYEFSQDGKKILVRKENALFVVASDANAPAQLDKGRVNLDGWTFSIIPRDEWRQVFVESWRMMRDHFYDRKMHGVNWPSIREKYLPLVARVNDRSELSDIIAEMVGELSALHIFVRYGDEREGTDKVETAFLGASLTRDEAAGGWRVGRITRSDPDYPSSRAPLAHPDTAVAEGEVITRINGRDTLSAPDPSVLLRGQAGKQVLLDVKSAAGATRRVITSPVSDEKDADLRYDEWELTRRERVENAGKGKIGYVHLRAMGSGDIAQWARDFYPVFNRQGLIIDVRNNQGGNIDSWVLGKLLRKAWFFWQPRVGNPSWNMQYAFRGHVVVICNERTASDGEAFSEGFKQLGLGKVIGTRTWGGEIWLSAQRWLVDRGMATAAEMGVYGPDGKWLIEGHGVDPDIVVDNLPHGTFKGGDAQLDAAIKHLEELIAKEPRLITPTPPHPDKSESAAK